MKSFSGIARWSVALVLTLALVSLAHAGPINDDLKDAFVLSGANTSAAGNNTGADLQGGEQDPLGVGGRSIWWNWTAPTSGYKEINTFGSAIDTVLYVFTGAGTDPETLTIVAADNDADGDVTSRVNFNAVGGTQYRIAVHGRLEIEGAIAINVVTPGTPPPANDNFANRTLISGVLPITRNGAGYNNAGATLEFAANEPDPLAAPQEQAGGASVWYHWTAPSTGQVQIDTFGSDFDTVLYVFTGSNLGSLTPVAADENSEGDVTSRAIFNATSGVNYKIAVHGFAGETGNITLHILSSAVSPPGNDDFALSTNLGSVTTANIFADSNIDAGVQPFERDPLFTGGASVWYKWTAPSNGWREINTFGSGFDTVLYVFTGTSLGGLVPVASSDDAGGTLQSRVNFNASDNQVYHIAVHGFLGETGSVNLELKPGTQPPGYDNFANKKDLGKFLSKTVPGFTNVGCTLEEGETDSLDSGGASAWFKFTADATTNYDINTFGSDFDTVLYVYTDENEIENIVELGANDDTAGSQSKVTISAVKDQKYRIAVHGFLGTAGSITLTVTTGGPPPGNDNFSNALTFSTTASGSNQGASLEPGEPDPTGHGGASVWWKWTAPSTGNFTVNTAGSDFDTLLYVFSGSSLGALTTLAFNDDSGGLSTSEAVFSATAGTTYHMAVNGYLGDTGTASLAIAAGGTPPPANDNFANADTSLVGATASDTGSNAGATTQTNEPDPFSTGGKSTWWSWTSTTTGWVGVNTFGSNFDTILYVFTGGPAIETLNLIAGDDTSLGTDQSRINFSATAGVTYHFAVHGDRGASGNISIAVGPGMPLPANDNFANRIFLGQTAPVSTAGSNNAASLESSELEPAGDGGASVWWSWEAPASGYYQIDTFGSDFDTVLGIYEGSAVDALVELAANDDAQDTFSSRVNFHATAGQTYQIAVHGNSGVSGDIALNIGTGVAPPANDDFADEVNLDKSKPADPPINWAGSNAGASLEPSEPDLGIGGASVWVKWKADDPGTYQINTFGSDIDTVLYLFSDNNDDILANSTLIKVSDDSNGTPQSSITFTAIDSERFRIAIHGKRDSWGNVSFQVSGSPVGIPANDDFASPWVLGSVPSASVSRANAGASLELLEPDLFKKSGNSLWWTWTAPSSGWYAIATTGSTVDTLLYVYTGTSLNNLTLVEANEDDNAGTDVSRVTLNAAAGQTYRIAVHAIDGEIGSMHLDIAPMVPDPPANDDYANATPLGSGTTLTTGGSSLGASIEPFEPDPTDEGGASVWYSWTPSTSGWQEINTFGSDFDSVLYVFSGTDLEHLVLRAFNDSGAGGNQSRVNFYATAGVTYYIAVNGDDGEEGAIALNLLPGVAPPGNDNVGSPVGLGSGPTAGASGNNSGASLQLFEPDPIRDGGTSVWYTWTAPSTGYFKIDTLGSAFDTLVYIFSGTDFSTFTLAGFNDNGAGTKQSTVDFFATSGTLYHIAVHGIDGETGAFNLAIGAGTPPPGNDNFATPTILATTSPIATTGNNTGATLELDEPDPLSEGGASVWYRWTAPSSGFFQVNTIGGTTNFDTILYLYEGDTLETLQTIAFNDEASGTTASRINFQAVGGTVYRIAVHGDDGASGPFNLNIGPGVSPPANDNFAGRIHLGGANVVTAAGSNVGATMEVGEPGSYLGTSGASVWWSWTAPASGTVAANTCGSQFDTMLYAYTGTVLTTLTELAADDDGSGLNFHSKVEFAVTLGQTYQFAVRGASGDTGAITLQISMLPPYETWLKNYPTLTGANALRFADPDKDGIRNIAELAFGLNPLLNSAPAGNDPMGGNFPVLVISGGMLQLHYTINAINLTGGRGLPIEITGGLTFDFKDFTPIAPISLGGQSYKVQVPMDATGQKQLTVLVTDPNP